MCKLFCKAIDDETIICLLGSSHKQYVLKELRGTLVILTNIKDKFDPEYPASHQEQKHEFIHYNYYSTFHITGQSQKNS